MAFGYKTPAFNVWARVWFASSPDNDSNHVVYTNGPWYFRCQCRAHGHALSQFDLECPKYLALRPVWITPFAVGDIVQLAGWGRQYGRIQNITDIGCGFANEHRSVGVILAEDESWDQARHLFYPAVNIELEPPEDANFLPEDLPLAEWAMPQEFEV